MFAVNFETPVEILELSQGLRSPLDSEQTPRFLPEFIVPELAVCSPDGSERESPTDRSLYSTGSPIHKPSHQPSRSHRPRDLRIDTTVNVPSLELPRRTRSVSEPRRRIITGIPAWDGDVPSNSAHAEMGRGIEMSWNTHTQPDTAIASQDTASRLGAHDEPFEQWPGIGQVVSAESRNRNTNFNRSKLPAQNDETYSIQLPSDFDSLSLASEDNGSHTCDACQESGKERNFCSACSWTYCGTCWDLQPLHKTLRPGRSQPIPHEKTLPEVAKKVETVLRPNFSTDDLNILHQRDMEAAWFGISHKGEHPVFRDYGQFDDLVASLKTSWYGFAATDFSTNPAVAQYPSLVSFVGETSAGKSSIIKLIIDLSSEQSQDFPTPVVGAAGSSDPTSGDVHLYLDPVSSTTRHPIMFADCEGLNAGVRLPLSAKVRMHSERMSDDHAYGSGFLPSHVSERELVWANDRCKQGRDYAVSQMYPRLLYTFSDVIVFVLKNIRAIEPVLVRLVQWAAAALEKSSNQPVLPHAIIALNASELNIPADQWDVESATESLLQSLSQLVDHEPTFVMYADFWRERQRKIHTVKDLLLSYYSSIKVVRIPDNGRPSLVKTQITKLTDLIKSACDRSHGRKASLRMLLNADELRPYLQYAFEQFSLSLEKPFDFVEASLKQSPIPPDFGGNILKLAIQIMEAWQDQASGQAIFEELSAMIAGCIMIDYTRHKIRGTAEGFFEQYLPHIDAALDNFCNRHYACEYVSQSGVRGRCVNVRSGHTKGHQSRNGTILAAGDYMSNFTFESYHKKLEEDVYRYLVALQDELRYMVEPEDRAAAILHKTYIMPHFFNRASGRASSNMLVNHSVCFCCLFEIPEHALPCGHVLCTPCMKTYGKVCEYDQHKVDVWECPINGASLTTNNNPWSIRLKPVECGIRLLTLDGGGIRGIVELEILKQLERALGGKLQIRDFFDLIVGTSTGGIIALGLTTRNWSVVQCIERFETLCKDAFTPRKGTSLPLFGPLVQGFHHSAYETKPLEDALKAAFSDDQYLFRGQCCDSSHYGVKVAVTATSVTGKAVVMSNYNRLPDVSASYQFERPEKPNLEIKTWQAARATSAAPTYFRPYNHTQSVQAYLDGGIYNNNPINVAERERKLLWPDIQNVEPDVIVSVGTGFAPNAKQAPPPKAIPVRGLIANGRFLAKLAFDHIAMSLDSEQTWSTWLTTKSLSPDGHTRRCRLNLHMDSEPPRLDDVSRLQELRMQTALQFGDDPVLKRLARRLIATSFYLETRLDDISPHPNRRKQVTGYIRCRFPRNDPRIRDLGNFIRNEVRPGYDAFFAIREHGHTTSAPVAAKLDSTIIENMTQDHGWHFTMPKIVIPVRNPEIKTSICLCYSLQETFPISGFPKSLSNDTGIPKVHRRVLTPTDSVRWSARPPSLHRKHGSWRPPQGQPILGSSELLRCFADESHLLGNATADDLERMAMYFRPELRDRSPKGGNNLASPSTPLSGGRFFRRGSRRTPRLSTPSPHNTAELGVDSRYSPSGSSPSPGRYELDASPTYYELEAPYRRFELP